MKKIISFLLALALCVSLCACGVSESGAQTAEQKAEYEAAQAVLQGSMETLMAGKEFSGVTGDKAVTMLYDSGEHFGYFTDEYVPESLRTMDPAQVRYVIRRVEDAEYVGSYSNNVAALRMVYTVEVMDLQRNLILGTKKFEGGDPPATLPEGAKNGNIGSAPSEEEIEAWILKVVGEEPAEDAPKMYVTVNVRVPEGWGVPYVSFFNDYDPAIKEYGAVRFNWGTEKNGEWYTVMIPSWATDIGVNTDPTLPGTDGWHETAVEDRLDTEGKDLWITVLDLEGTLEFSRGPAAE